MYSYRHSYGCSCTLYEKWKTIDNIDLKNCMGKAVVVHLPNFKTLLTRFVPEDFNSLEEHIKNSSIVLFNTGWIYKVGTEEFYKHPYISKSSAQYLKDLGIKQWVLSMLNVDKTVLKENNILKIQHQLTMFS